MKGKALIVHGGWDGHEPVKISKVFSRILKSINFEVEISDTLDSFKDEEKLKKLDLIVPHWTMGEIEEEQLEPVLKAVESGVGIAGIHGGMCDAFRESVRWQFMTGGQWVAHPGGDNTDQMIYINKASSSPIVKDIDDFEVSSEQYYMHVDPAVDVLATTRFPVEDGPHSANGKVDCPVVWTKYWGEGRVFYNSLGHHADIVEIEEVTTLMRRGFLWAAKKEVQ
ncbi:MAG: ThuA domain-containing protein [Halanaerobiales bacterium]